MSRATILFYNEKLNTEPIFEKLVLAKGLSKSEFTAFLFRQAKEACELLHYESFAIVNRIDTITEVKNG
jgi:hypothetical protein